MAARTLQLRASLVALLKETRYTLSRLAAHPLGTPHVPAFQGLRSKCMTVLAAELDHQEAISEAQAKVDAADDNLDDFAGRLSKALLIITRDDRTHSTYLHFFGDKTLTDFRRPTLGEQYLAMVGWSGSLQGSEHASLKAMAPELADLLAVAADAMKAKAAAKQQNKQFRDVGERKQLVDELNAARKEIYGALAKLPHVQPGLPSNFADQFFRRETTDDAAEEPEETVESVTARIASLEEELKQEKARLEELKTEETEAAKAAKALEDDKAALAALETEMAEAAKKAEALRAKISKR